uniref:MAM and LDL-receptor class A domain-containing protein 1-like isoform X2 n=1 Tax=Ciona intestinalis TaxID=7719 RepID=UPI000EF4759B|nr:MAM and LDL-receptor class A domain-containing protein 1-like isoform X2 [Ciona intestinalis]|eukprot:XP_026693747.1 MAM and LDL-receptor class A domain-containing protein 1-like isoform X2 [Ciona intestinalis]
MPRIYCDAIERTIVNSDRHQKEFGKMFFIFIVLLELSQSTGNVLTVNRGFEGAIPAIPSLSCDFDFDFCSWRNDSSAEFTWIRRQGETPSIYTGPPWDHTTKDANVGHYIYIETSSPRQKGDKARLVSQVIGTAGTYCLRWLHMHGLNVKDLNVYLKGRLTHRVRMLTRLSGPWSIEGRDEPRVFGEDGDWWNEERVEFNIVEPAQLVLEGVRGENYRGDIAIDDITITQSSCPSALVDCSFDNDTCGWRQMFDDDFNWLPNVGETRTRDTGPSSDHTRADNVVYDITDGRYLFIEASWPRVEGDKARLLSTDISCATNTSPTFTFWYNMHGTGTGVLRVYTMVGATTNLLWQLSGNQGEDWRRASVQIPTNFVNSNERFNIIIEGERKDYKGDSAIDDITMTGCYITNDDNNTGVYNSSVTAATSTQPFTPINITGVVDGDSPLLDSLSCNFDQQNICGWSHDVNGDFDWTINKGKTLSLRTGPIHDHTSGVGWYIYMEASSPRLRGQTAILRTPPIPASLRICMRFYYHMFGKSMGSLSVFIARPSVPRLIPKWSADGQQSSNQSEWKFAEVDLFQTFVYQIIIRGTRGSSFYSDMAIDDITITRGGCRKYRLLYHKS